MDNKKSKILKTLLLVFVVVIYILAIIYFLPLVKNLNTEAGKIFFKEKIASLNVVGVLILFLMQFAQIFLVIIPGEIMEVLAGICYGKLWGTIFILVSCFLITLIILWFVRKYGKKFIYSFIKKEKVDSMESFFKDNESKIEKILLVLFLLPGTPKDLLVYVGAMLDIDAKKFVLMSTFGRFPSIITSTFAGDKLFNGDIISVILIYVVTFIVIILGSYFLNKKGFRQDV